MISNLPPVPSTPFRSLNAPPVLADLSPTASTSAHVAPRVPAAAGARAVLGCVTGAVVPSDPPVAFPLPIPLSAEAKRDARVQEALSSWSSLQERIRFCDNALSLPRNQRASVCPAEHRKAWRERGRPLEALGWGLMTAAGFTQMGRGLAYVFTVGGSTLLPFAMGVAGLGAGFCLCVLPLERLAHCVANRTLERRLQNEKTEASQRLDQASAELLRLAQEYATSSQSGDSVAIEEQYVEIGGLKVPRRSLPDSELPQSALLHMSQVGFG